MDNNNKDHDNKKKKHSDSDNNNINDDNVSGACAQARQLARKVIHEQSTQIANQAHGKATSLQQNNNNI